LLGSSVTQRNNHPIGNRPLAVKARRDTATQRNDRLIGNRPLVVKAQRDTIAVYDVVIMSCRKIFQSLAVTARAEGLSELREHHSDSKSKDV
jgi:hypothetical protein